MAWPCDEVFPGQLVVSHISDHAGFKSLSSTSCIFYVSIESRLEMPGTRKWSGALRKSSGS